MDFGQKFQVDWGRSRVIQMQSLFRFVSLLLLATALSATTGSLTGIVQDQATMQPLIGANVIIQDTDFGAATDSRGSFTINNIPVGSYHVKAMMMGYEPEVKLNVHVVPSRQTILTFDLPLAVLEMQAVDVTRSYFKKEPDVVTSSRTVDYEEIRSDPGGVYDIQRMMQTLPAVVSAADQDNEIIVRGGAPGENLFIMDHIEIPNPNHFGYQGAGGGPVNMINTEFVDQVDLIAGAFPAKYGGKASSVMDIRLREGSREEYNFDLDMNMAGFGINAEGPIMGGKGSFLASFKLSYLDLVIKSFGMTAVPHYWSTQGKVVYDLSETQQLIANIIYGNDAIAIIGEPSPQSRGAENVDVKGHEYAAGISLKSLWSKNTYSLLTAYRIGAWWYYDVFKYEYDFSEDDYYKDHYYFKDDTETGHALKADFVHRASKRLEFRSGFQFKRMNLDYENWYAGGERNFYNYSRPETPNNQEFITSADTFYTYIFPIIDRADSVVYEADGVWAYYRDDEVVRAYRSAIDTVFQGWDMTENNSFDTYQLFAQAKFRPLLKLTVNAGFHYFYSEYNSDYSIEPRLGLSYHLSEKSTINAAYTKHYQAPSFALMASDPSGRKLKNKHTTQLVLGYEYLFAKDIRAVVEIYRKDYSDLPISVSDTTISELDYSSELISAGEGYARGIEFLLQKKLAERYWGTVSYSYYITQGRDPRYPNQEKYYNWPYDYRNVFTVSGGAKYELHKKTWYNELKSKKWWGFISWMPFAPSDEWELGIRYRYVGGKPYTPQVYYHQYRSWFPPDGGDYSTDRLRAYSRFDIMIMQRHFFKKMNLTAFMNIENVFNVKNIWDIQYNADGTTSDVLQYQTFIIGGFNLEF